MRDLNCKVEFFLEEAKSFDDPAANSQTSAAKCSKPKKVRTLGASCNVFLIRNCFGFLLLVLERPFY